MNLNKDGTIMTDFSRIQAGFDQRYPHAVWTLDSHTAGEPTRLVVGGLPPLQGQTLLEKRSYFMNHLDHLREALTKEPRGHRGMFAAAAIEPTTLDSDFGLIYMDPKRYPYLCGHGTIGAVTALMETGAIPIRGPRQTVVIDTPAGPMEARAEIDADKVTGVAFTAVPSFVYAVDQPLRLSSGGRIKVSLVYAGGFFAMVDAAELGLTGADLAVEFASQLKAWGMEITEEANRQLEVVHPLRPDVTTVDVTEFYHTQGVDQGRGAGVVIYGEAHMDRSPCGTGTTAKLTLLHHLGLIDVGRPFVNAGPLGTTFEAKILDTVKIGDADGVQVEIKGQAHITGLHRFAVDPADPFPKGFLM
jgi:proline racemase